VWTSGYLPLHKGDFETIKNSAQIDTREQKEAMAHFEIAIDHALLEHFNDADHEFAAALKYQPTPDLKRLIQNRLQSVENMVRMPDAPQRWLAKHRGLLD
jgi:hypothetical protein